MARKRDLRPGFFRNEHLTAMPFEARLLFAGLWTLADRDGRLEDRPRRIKLELFPADDVDVDSMLEQLATCEEPFIERYQVEGRGFIQVLTWQRNQNPHPNEAESEIPPPDDPRSTKVLRTDDQGHTQQGLLSVSSCTSVPSMPSGSSGGARTAGDTSRRPKAKKSLEQVGVPEPLKESSEFCSVWRKWLEHRKQKRQPMTANAQEQALTEMVAWGVDRAVAAVKHSLGKGYQGIYEPNGRGPPESTDPRGNLSAHRDFLEAHSGNTGKNR